MHEILQTSHQLVGVHMNARLLVVMIVLGVVSVNPALGGSVLYNVTGTFMLSGGLPDTADLDGATFQLTLEIDSAAAGTPIGTSGVEYGPGDFTIAESVIMGSTGIYNGTQAITIFQIFGDDGCCSLVWKVEAAGQTLRIDIIFMPATLWAGSAPTDPIGTGLGDIAFPLNGGG